MCNCMLFLLLLFDLDYFKVINDGYGYDVGDCVLQYVVGLFGQLIRGSDYLFCYGGEEFVVVLVVVSELQVLVIVESLCWQIVQLLVVLVNGQVLELIVSIGVVGYDGYLDYEWLMVCVDVVMYEVKCSGCNCVVVVSVDLQEVLGWCVLQ